MIAQKLKNNEIAIGQNVTLRKDALEVIHDLRVAEFFKLVKATNNWVDKLTDNRDIMFTHYESPDSKICKEFDKIYARRKTFVEKAEIDNEKEVEEQSEVYSNITPKTKQVTYDSKIKGTSRLIRIPKKQIIKITRRKGLTDDNNKPNSVCIDNLMREEFFADIKKTAYFKSYKVYEIMYNELDKETYEKWDAIISRIYEEGLNGNS